MKEYKKGYKNGVNIFKTGNRKYSVVQYKNVWEFIRYKDADEFAYKRANHITW